MTTQPSKTCTACGGEEAWELATGLVRICPVCQGATREPQELAELEEECSRAVQFLAAADVLVGALRRCANHDPYAYQQAREVLTLLGLWDENEVN